MRSQRITPLRECAHCGAAFRRYRGDRAERHNGTKFCTRECYDASRSPGHRFWLSIRKTDACWIWSAQLYPSGYGYFHADGENWRAHRFSWFLHHGPIPDGLWVLHKCDVRACVRPDHLYLGTIIENTRDAIERKRLTCGERSQFTRFKNEDVLKIRAASADGIKPKVLASQYGVDVSTIRRIVRRARWKHL